VANDRLEHFALVERANNGSDHVHQFEVLSLHVAPKRALRSGNLGSYGKIPQHLGNGRQHACRQNQLFGTARREPVRED
jgi:hypothetical protein